MSYVSQFRQKRAEDPAWRPYCLMCSTMGRMTPTPYGFRCDGTDDMFGRKGCGNKINHDGLHYDGAET